MIRDFLLWWYVAAVAVIATWGARECVKEQHRFRDGAVAVLVVSLGWPVILTATIATLTYALLYWAVDTLERAS